MSILLTSFFAMLIFLLYINSLFTPLKSALESQHKMQEALKELEDNDIPASVGIGFTKVTGAVLLLFYVLFYISAACILNQLYFTLVSALFVVLSIRSMIKFFQFIENKKLVIPRWYHKLNPISGIVYTSYFIVTYYNMHLDRFSNFIIGSFVAIILFILIKLKDEKNRKELEARKIENESKNKTL